MPSERFSVSLLATLVLLSTLLSPIGTSAFIVETQQPGLFSNSRAQFTHSTETATCRSLFPQLLSHVPRASRTTTTLYATTKNKKQSTTTSGSGFGSSSSSSSNTKQQQLRSVSSKQMGAGNKSLRAATNAFDKIRKRYGASTSYDVYIRSPQNDAMTFWFVGKVAIEPQSGDDLYQPTVQDACISQKRLILEYSKLYLRPQNFGGTYANTLELWVAPGDSEMDVVQNKVNLTKIVGSAADINPNFRVDTVGFNPEIYVGDEITEGGLRVKRDENGFAMKPVFDVLEGE